MSRQGQRPAFTPERAGRPLPERTREWHAKRMAKLAALADQHPKLAYDAQVLGELRRAFAEMDGRESEIVAELHAHGLNDNEIAWTLHMLPQSVQKHRQRWEQAIS